MNLTINNSTMPNSRFQHFGKILNTYNLKKLTPTGQNVMQKVFDDPYFIKLTQNPLFNMEVKLERRWSYLRNYVQIDFRDKNGVLKRALDFTLGVKISDKKAPIVKEAFMKKLMDYTSENWANVTGIDKVA